MTSSDSYQPLTLWQYTLPHLVFLGLAVVVILLSFVMHNGDETGDASEEVYLPWMETPMPRSCSARVMFGISCPGCGLTRSFIAISHGNFSRAWKTNPASFLLYSFVLIQIPWHLFQLSRVRRKMPRVQTLWIYVPIVTCAVALLLQWIIRTSMGITNV